MTRRRRVLAGYTSAMTSRRTFLRTGAMALGGSMFGCGATETAPASAGPWGLPGDDRQAAALLEAARRPEAILDFYLFGGMSPWDTFYVVPELNDPAAGGPHAGNGWWLFQQGAVNTPDQFARCGGGSRPLTQDFALDAANNNVRLGPWLYPLRDRPDILDRMRVMVMRHDQVPHQGGNPLSLTGHRFGSPRLAGTAAHVQRFFGDQDPRAVPHAHVLLPRNRDAEVNNADAAAAIGLHPASARPLTVWLSDQSELSSLLARESLEGRTDAYETLHSVWGRQASARLSSADGIALRRPTFDAYQAARQSVASHKTLQELLPDEALALASGASCEQESNEDYTTTGLGLATRLILDASNPARYVISVDGGLLPATGGAAYDTHSRHVLESSRNITHAMRRLAERINEPGEQDPTKLDLDRHTVLITTEFGRSPHSEGDDGTDHWPEGYVQVVIGSLVEKGSAGVVGSIGVNGHADEHITPEEFRAALLLAQGIWPFHPESFAVGDIREGDTEEEAALYLRERVLGVRG
jgi:hypothetical protein